MPTPESEVPLELIIVLYFAPDNKMPCPVAYVVLVLVLEIVPLFTLL